MPDWHIAYTLGLLLVACLCCGQLAERLHLPKVTAYLLVGLALGPGALHLVPHVQLEDLEPITELAMGLVLFNLGSQFPLPYLRRILGRVSAISFGELFGTFALVTVGLLAIGQRWEVAVLLGTLALATAPATTILVLKESESDGRVTDYAGALVGLNNLVAILAFELVFVGITVVGGELETPVASTLVSLLLQTVGAIGVGAMAGLAVTFGCGLLERDRWLVLLIGAATIVLGVSRTFEYSYMLAFLAMGFTVANASDATAKITGQLDRMTGLLCVLFFAIHGAELDLRAFVNAGLVGVAYIVFRSAGKYLGTAVAARAIDEEEPVRRWLGAALVAQAGAALSLAAITRERDPVVGEIVQTVILGSVVVFEIIGPILVRMAVLRAGEVPLAHAIHHSSHTPLGEMRSIRDRLLLAIGRDPTAAKSPDELTIDGLVRRNVEGIAAAATFDDVVNYIEHSRDDTYPVLDGDRSVVGLIRYPLLSSALFDPDVGSLVLAEDLSTPLDFVLHPDETVDRALELFGTSNDDCIPVVLRGDRPAYQGIVRRSDVTSYLIRGRKSR